MKAITSKYHVGGSTEIRYDIILGWDIHTVVKINDKVSKDIITIGEGPYEFWTEPMFDLKDN